MPGEAAPSHRKETSASRSGLKVGEGLEVTSKSRSSNTPRWFPKPHPGREKGPRHGEARVWVRGRRSRIQSRSLSNHNTTRLFFTGGGLIVSENHHQTAKATTTSQLGGNEGHLETEIQLCGDRQKLCLGRFWWRACVRARPPAPSPGFEPRAGGAGPTRTPGGGCRSLFTGLFFQWSRSLWDGDPQRAT